MLASRICARLLARRLEDAVCATQSCTFSAAAAEPATAQDQGRWEHNQAAILHGIEDMRFEHHPLPQELAPDNVRIRPRATGICGSDVHFYRHGRIGQFIVEAPMVLGHETAGDVVAVGSAVTRLQVGDRVALEPGLPCWGNTLPRTGRYNLCPDIKFFATPPVHGTLADYVDHREDFCFRLPENVSYEMGALVEPFSNGIHACRRGQVGPGKKVAILGAGPMGLNALAAARAFAASRVAITDVRSDTFAVAEQLGVGAALQTPASLSPARIAEELVKLLPPHGPDVVIDCAGFDSTLQTALEAVSSGGRVVIVGMGQPKGTLNTGQLVVKEVDVHGCFRYTNTYPLALEMLTCGQVVLDPIISHRYPFSKQGVQDGFDCAVNVAETKAIKVMFNVPAA